MPVESAPCSQRSTPSRGAFFARAALEGGRFERVYGNAAFTWVIALIVSESITFQSQVRAALRGGHVLFLRQNHSLGGGM